VAGPGTSVAVRVGPPGVTEPARVGVAELVGGGGVKVGPVLVAVSVWVGVGENAEVSEGMGVSGVRVGEGVRVNVGVRVGRVGEGVRVLLGVRLGVPPVCACTVGAEAHTPSAARPITSHNPIQKRVICIYLNRLPKCKNCSRL